MQFRVLVVTSAFPYYSPRIGGMIRVATLVDKMVNDGCHVHVLTYKRWRQWNDTVAIETPASSHYVNSYPIFWEDFKNYSHNKNPIAYFSNYLRKLRRWNRIDSYECDIQRFFRNSVKIIKKYSIDNLLITVPPHSFQLLGAKIKNYFENKINLIYDHRDAWTLRKQYIKNISPPILEKWKKIEQACFNLGDHHLFVSEGMATDHQRHFFIKSSSVIENGYIDYNTHTEAHPAIWSTIKEFKRSKRVVLGYFGTGSSDETHPHKDFGPLFRVLDSCPDLAAKFSLILCGDISIDERIPQNLKVSRFSPLSNQIARETMRHLDVGLVVHSEPMEAPHVIGGKAYDYMASNIFIWFIAPPNANSIKSLHQKFSSTFLSDIYKPENIKSTLEQLLHINFGQNNTSDEKYPGVEYYSRDFQFSKLYPLLNGG